MSDRVYITDVAALSRKVFSGAIIVLVGSIAQIAFGIFVVNAFIALGIVFLIPTALSFLLSFRMMNYYGPAKYVWIVGPLAFSPSGIVVIISMVLSLIYGIGGLILGVDEFYIAILPFLGGAASALGLYFLMTAWATIHRGGYVKIKRDRVSYDFVEHKLIPEEKE